MALPFSLVLYTHSHTMTTEVNLPSFADFQSAAQQQQQQQHSFNQHTLAHTYTDTLFLGRKSISGARFTIFIATARCILCAHVKSGLSALFLVHCFH